MLLEGVLQNQEGVISVHVQRVAPMREAHAAETVDVTDADVRARFKITAFRDAAHCFTDSHSRIRD